MQISKYLTLICLLLLISCSSEKPSEVSGQKPPAPPTSGGPAYVVEIAPTNASRNTPICLVPHGFGLPDAKVEWLVNGSPAETQKPGQLISSEIKKGDSVQAKAIIQGEEVLSNTIQIRNSPPEISKVRLLPDSAKPGDTLSVEAEGLDADGDTVSFTYEWTRNGEPAGKEQQIEGHLRRGDKIRLTITASDGEENSRPIILQRDIKNVPPAITDNRRFSFDGKVYTFQVTAADPDGDPLTYSLQSGPTGMTINPTTGLVHWDVPASFRGRVPFVVVVSDGQGGEARKSFGFALK